MDIKIENENAQLVEYKINFEQAKEYLTAELEKYQKLVVTEEYMQMAKKSRAELNAKKAELKSKMTEIKKKHNEPIEKLNEKVNELLELIEKPLNKIDEQIKEYEEKVRKQKKEDIEKIFEDAKRRYNFDKVKIETIFNPQWLNVSYTKKKITSEIEVFFSRVTSDLEVIDSFDDEFVIPLKELYLECFDMSTIMQRKIAYDKAKQERLQKEKEEEEKRRLEELKNQQIEEEVEVVEVVQDKADIYDEYFDEEIPELETSENAEGDLSNEIEVELENIPEEAEKPQEIQSECSGETNEVISNDKNEIMEHIPFWVDVTPAQKLKMREFILSNNIKCGKLKQKSTEEIVEILTERLNSVYCDNCQNTDSSCCDECNRKQMYWSLSRTEAKNIAVEILA